MSSIIYQSQSRTKLALLCGRNWNINNIDIVNIVYLDNIKKIKVISMSTIGFFHLNIKKE